MAGTILAELTLQGDKAFRRGIDAAADEMEQASGSAGLLGGSMDHLSGQLRDVIPAATIVGSRLDETGDEAAEAGRKSMIASGGFATLSASLFPVSVGASIATSRLGMLAAALTAVSIAAAPVATGLLGVAAGFAAVGGVLAIGLVAGAVTHMQELKAAVKSTATEVKAAIQPIGELFGPVLLKAVRAIPQLVRNIVDAMGNLKPFRDALLELGAVAMNTLPQIFGALADLARQLLPLFTKVVTVVLQGIAPALRAAGGAAERLRQGFLDVLGPAQYFLKANQRTIGALGKLAGQLQRFAKLVVIAALRIGTTLGPALAPLISMAARGFKAFNDFAASLLNVRGSSYALAAGARQALGALAEIVGNVFTELRQQVGLAFYAINALAERDLRGFVRMVGMMFDSARGAAVSSMRKLATLLPKPIQRAITKVQTVTAAALGRVEQFWMTHAATLKRIVRDVFGFVKAHPDMVLTALASTVVPVPLGLIVTAFKNNLGLIKREVTATFGSVLRSVRSTMAAIKRQIITPLTTAGTRANQLLGSLRTEFQQTFRVINDIVTRVMGVVLKHFGKTLREMLAIWRVHISGGGGLLANARTAFNALWFNVIKPILDIIQAGWRMFGDELIAILDVTLGVLGTTLKVGFDALLTTVNVILDLISGDWEGAWNSIAGFLDRTLNTMLGAVRSWNLDGVVFGVLNSVYQHFVTLKNSAINAVQNMISGVMSAIRNWSLAGAIKDKVDAAINEAERLYNSVIGNSIIPEMTADVNAHVKRWDFGGAMAEPMTAAEATVAGTSLTPGTGGGGGDTIITNEIHVTESTDARETAREITREIERQLGTH